LAQPNLSEIVTTTLRNRTGALQDNVSRNNALLARLNKKGRIRTFSGGRTIVQELDYANNQTFQYYSGYQTLNIAPSAVFTAAEFPIRQAALAISISGLEEIQNS
jgi:predicted aminopeptidase